MRMITHGIDMPVVNSWLEYVNQAKLLGVQKNKILDLWDFRMSVAQYLILHKDPPKRGRPSSGESNGQENNKRHKTEARPQDELRYDNYGHFPNIDDKKESTRCKLENCKGKSKTFCVKCNVHLCFTSGRNCFLNFHMK